MTMVSLLILTPHTYGEKSEKAVYYENAIMNNYSYALKPPPPTDKKV